MPVGVHLAVIDPGVGGSRRALALRDGEGRLYVGPGQRAAPARGRAVRRRRRGPRACEPGLRAAAGLAHLPRPRPLLSRRCAPRNGVELGELGPPVVAETLARLDLPQPDHRRGNSPGVRPLRRPLRERAGEPRPRAHGADRDRTGDAGGARLQGRALLRRRGADLRGRAARRHPAVRGLLPEHRAGDQRRQRGGDVGRAAGDTISIRRASP